MSDGEDGPQRPGGAGGFAGGPGDGGDEGAYAHPGGHGAGHGAHDDVGPLSEEAAKLFGVLAGWTREVNDHVATGAPECIYCPVCRTIHVVRECSPEVRDHLATAAASLMQAAARVLTAAGEQQSGSTGAGGDTGPGAPVEHIDLDPDLGAAPWPDPGPAPDAHPPDADEAPPGNTDRDRG